MSDPRELKAGDPCPTCGGALTLDPRQDPAALIARHTRNADSPPAAARYKDAVEAKVAEFGLIHRCAGCGYQARLPTARRKPAAA